MRLLFSPTSPYVRKVRATAIEKGLEASIALQPADVFGDEATVAPINPLRKVPALILDSGEALYDSPVICEYLDSLAPEPALLPPGGPARWSVLRTQALADGIADAGFNIVMERRRPESQRSDEWQGRWRAAILRAATALDQEAQGWDAAVDLGRIAVACALGYVDFRLAEIDWRAGNAALAAWFAEISSRPSLAGTAPPAA